MWFPSRHISGLPGSNLSASLTIIPPPTFCSGKSGDSYYRETRIVIPAEAGIQKARRIC
jgi:hypothetical protein